jgi:hypothetical protein
VVSFLLRQLYSQRKSARHPLDRRLGGPQSRSGQGVEGRNSQPLPGIEPLSSIVLTEQTKECTVTRNRVQAGSGALSASYPAGNAGSSRGNGREADHLPPSSAEIKNVWSYTRVYLKVSGLAAWSENCKWYSSLPLGAVVSLFCESS